MTQSGHCRTPVFYTLIEGVQLGNTQIREWLEVIGIFGVIVSLMFVGMEMRQNQRIAISAANQARTETTVQFLTALALDPDFRAMVSKVRTDPEELTTEELFMRGRISDATLFIYENIHYQYLEGFIPEERWQGTIRLMEGGFSETSSQGIRGAYMQNPEAWSDSFREVIDKIIVDVDKGQ